MAKFFISYRREDSQHQADRLHTALKQYVDDPKHDIFIDIDNIPFGVDFIEHLSSKVSQCEVLLALIGDRWLQADPVSGKPRINEPNDFVRIEIAAALKRGIPVVPVLLDGAPFPSPDQLPEELKPLSRRNGVPVQRLSFDADVARMINGLPISSDLRFRNRSTWAGKASLQNAEAKERAAVFSSLEKSLDETEYREFLNRFSDGPETTTAQERLEQLASWSKVDQSDADAIAFWFAQNPRGVFRALEQVARRAQKRAQTTDSENATTKLALWAIPIVVVALSTVVLMTNGMFSQDSVPAHPTDLIDMQEDPVRQATDTTLGSGDLYTTVENEGRLPLDVISGRSTREVNEAEGDANRSTAEQAGPTNAVQDPATQNTTPTIPRSALLGTWRSSDAGCPRLSFSQGNTSERVIIKKFDMLLGEYRWVNLIGIDQASIGDPLQTVAPGRFRTTSLADDYDILLKDDDLRIIQPSSTDWLKTSEMRDCVWQKDSD
ncbi:MAG: toll/interleukin-1 receptor domain-containing protein [Hyphomonadaceae bacterium]|nr:toll/interleukin-1 receptor domain-containing protein [Hyphomonadaceae bacterium]